MIHEVTELLAAHLEHETLGVNALLADALVAEGDGLPPVVLALAHEFCDGCDWLLAEKEPPTVPGLIVVVRRQADVSVATGTQRIDLGHARDLWVGVTYAARDAITPRARRESAYVLRAVGQSLTRFVGRPQHERTLRGVTIGSIDALQEVPLAPSQGRGGLVGMMVAHLGALDDRP